MAKDATGRRIIGSRHCRACPYPLTSIHEDSHEIVEKKDWEDATCSVCIEYPHNAVLLLCSSYDKGCRPYMCGTSYRHSNCLDQYMKHTKVTLPHESQPHVDTTEGVTIGPLSSWDMDKTEAVELPCPLCRGQVKGWTVVEPAREYLNAKKRNCMQENCSFVGSYKQLKKHVRVNHPSARPHKIDPLLKQKWRRLEHDQERNDVISTIRSSMPGAVVFGDYVIEPNQNGLDSDEEDDIDANTMNLNEDFNIGIDNSESNFMNMFLFLQAFDSAGNIRERNAEGNGGVSRVNRRRRHGLYYPDLDDDSDEAFYRPSRAGVSLGNRLSDRVPPGRLRRRRHRFTSLM